MVSDPARARARAPSALVSSLRFRLLPPSSRRGALTSRLQNSRRPVQITSVLRECWSKAVLELSTYAILLSREADTKLKSVADPAALLATQTAQMPGGGGGGAVATATLHKVEHGSCGSKAQAALMASWIKGTREARDRLARIVLARIHTPLTVAPREVRCAAAESLVTPSAVAQLKARGFCVFDDVLTAAAVDGARLYNECAALHSVGVVSPDNATPCNPGTCGGFLRCGSAEDLALYGQLGCTALQQTVRLLLGLAHALQANGYTSPPLAVPPQVLVSAYPPGGLYKQHADCYGRGHNARQLTCLLYANPGWDASTDGGCLRLEAHNPTETVVVPPLSGALVLFEAARIYHAVEVSRKLRFAVTLWLWEANDE